MQQGHSDLPFFLKTRANTAHGMCTSLYQKDSNVLSIKDRKLRVLHKQIQPCRGNFHLPLAFLCSLLTFP